MTGQEIILFLQSRGFRLTLVPGGGFAIWPLSQLSDLQKSVIRQHVDVILEALAHSVAPFPCPACRGAAWLAPEDGTVPRYWTCGQCSAWGRIRDQAPHPSVWMTAGTVH